MTQQEYFHISSQLQNQYDFYVYYSEYPYRGILVEHDHSYYIVHPRQQNDWKEHGIKVRLKDIMKWPVAEQYQIPTSQMQPMPIIKAKKMIIFGAGASCGYSYSEGIQEIVPPLTKDIFDLGHDQLLKQFRGARALASDIGRSENLEDYFQAQWERVTNHHDPLLLRKLISTQCYIYSLFNHISKTCSGNRTNNYSVLVKQAREYAESQDELVLFVNFNYDLLIEEALMNDGLYNFGNIGDYIDFDKKHILLFKPHGSCNWSRRVIPDHEILKPVNHAPIKSFQEFSNYLYGEGILPYQFGDYFEREILINFPPMTHDASNISKAGELQLFYPQILIPYKNKDEFIMPDSHLNMLHYLLQNIEEILIVGWKGTEDKFQNLLKLSTLAGRKVKITAITNGSEDVKLSFKESLPMVTDDDWTFHKKGFADFILKQQSFFKISN